MGISGGFHGGFVHLWCKRGSGRARSFGAAAPGSARQQAAQAASSTEGRRRNPAAKPRLAIQPPDLLLHSSTGMRARAGGFSVLPNRRGRDGERTWDPVRVWSSGAGPSRAHGDAREHPRPPAEPPLLWEEQKGHQALRAASQPCCTPAPSVSYCPRGCPVPEPGWVLPWGRGQHPGCPPRGDLSPIHRCPTGV